MIAIFVQMQNNMIRNMQLFFQRRSVQYLSHFMGIILWTLIIWFDDLNSRTFESNFQLAHIFNWLIPDLLLVFNAFYQNKISWAVILFGVSFMSFIMFFTIFADPIGIPMFLLFTGMSFAVYLMRPIV